MDGGKVAGSAAEASPETAATPTPANGVDLEKTVQYKGGVTPFVIMVCLVAAIGGSIFGYDIGISGGVTSMDPFLETFFPAVYGKKKQQSEGNYCRYDSQVLSAYVSSLYLAGLAGSLAAGPATRRRGRRASIIFGGLCYATGAALGATAAKLPVIVFGRIFLGFGIGFGNQAVPLYLSEMAPAHLRGGLSVMFQLATTVAIFSANMINYGTEKIRPWGWRLSLALAAAPAILMAAGGLFLPDTPNSLVARGHHSSARAVLEKIRGTPAVDAEFRDMVDALVVAALMPAFQILTGINAVLFYAPMLFQSMGFTGNASLYSSVVTGAVLVMSTVVSVFTVDRWGRRPLLIAGGIQMIVCQVIVAVVLGLKFGNGEQLSKGFSVVVVAAICLFVAAFGWSWGPLGWTVPSEIFPLETRSAGQSITVAVNLLFTFAFAQSFLSLLCMLKFGAFLFFAGWVAAMTAFVVLFLPETKGVPIEEMEVVWRNHWFWKKFLYSHSTVAAADEA
ncbi:Sugar transport protein 7 [Apostasia shenzhenica]|uniref:Sugar transport protein 7 n=1 Tax=Apostasia shenzhenica TaxID=1088818 RepID=A0A2H9ZYD5_9ASPA|nr:Sugar transport protein 7 [Apostasia shenzhenica]